MEGVYGMEMQTSVTIDEDASSSVLLLQAAYRAMEPVSVVLALARGVGKGVMSERVQDIFMRHCLKDEVCRMFPPIQSYTMRVLKEVLLAAESDGCEVLDALYEEYTRYLLLGEDNKTGGYKTFTYVVRDQAQTQTVTLRISSNILEGGTGCFAWPAGILLTELIFSLCHLFTSKCCLELGSGAGLVGVALTRIQASKVVLTDGDLTTLSNLRHNLAINGITVAEHHTADCIKETVENTTVVVCERFCWESASAKQEELHAINADIILGADLVYDPITIPHLISVLVLLLSRRANSETKPQNSTNRDSPMCRQADVSEVSNNKFPYEGSHQSSKHKDIQVHSGSGSKESVCSSISCSQAGYPVAYLTTTKRNLETLSFFLVSACAAGLHVLDVTDSMQPFQYLQGLSSLDRSAILIHKIFW